MKKKYIRTIYNENGNELHKTWKLLDSLGFYTVKHSNSVDVYAVEYMTGIRKAINTLLGI